MPCITDHFFTLAAAGTTKIQLVLFTFIFCTAELLMWLALLLFAIITVRYGIPSKYNCIELDFGILSFSQLTL